MIATLLVLAAGSLSGVTPVQKVIQMMNEMKAKGEAEMDAEQKVWHEYKKWCKNTSTEKDHAIRTAEMDIERLIATIQKNTAKAGDLADKIAVLDGDINTWSGDLKSASEIRTKEHADFKETNRDYEESIDALGRAVTTLSSQSAPTAQAAELLQKLAVLKQVPAGTQQAIVSLLDTTEDQPSGAPAANGYEFQSGGVVDMLEKLNEKFKEELATLQEDESNAKHAYDMMALNLENEVKAAKKEREAKAAAKAEHETEAAEAKGTLGDTQAQKAEDEKYQKELITQCDLKKDAFNARQKLRKEELEAIAKATEIISGQAVKGSAEKHLPSLVQKKVFAMLRATSTSAAQKRVAALLESRGHALRSDGLSLLALRAHTDPMEKVRGMIRDMIKKLQEEAAEEAAHKEWCDGELHDNKLTREEKTEQVDSLRAMSEKLSSEITTLANEITVLAQQVAELDEALAEATSLRAEEKAKNTQTIKDATAAISAVQSALTVLKEFYAGAAEQQATALVQGPADDAPGSWDEPAVSGGSAGGVVGMLEVIESDFARLESDTSADEAQAQSEFEKFSDESTEDKEAKVADSKRKVAKQTKKERELAETEKDLAATQKELDAALAYFDELKPACLKTPVSYEERVQRREAEIASLNEAWTILDDSSK